jgi:hypothetical protein
MTQPGLLKYSYLAYLSQPANDRQIYRAIRHHRVGSIVELGVGYAQRAQRMLEVASRFWPDEEIHYTGIDLFEARPAENPGITLKLAYKLLKRLNANVRLVPGDPFMALARAANNLTDTDLIVIAADQDPEAMSRAWSLIPRMIHEDSLVFQERSGRAGGNSQFVRLGLQEIEHLAGVPLRYTKIAA